MLSLESFMLTENYYNFFCIIKIPIHGIDSKGLGFVFFLFSIFYFLFSSFASLFFLEKSSLKVLSFSSLS